MSWATMILVPIIKSGANRRTGERLDAGPEDGRLQSFAPKTGKEFGSFQICGARDLARRKSCARDERVWLRRSIVG